MINKGYGMDNQVNSAGGTTSAKCPNCAANIFYNEKAGKLVCNMCGGLFAPESLKPLGRIETRDTGEAGEEEDNKQEFVCDSCGAAVVTDYNTSATFCAFCGSATLIKKRLSRCFRPDLIIPFKVSKDEAIANYLKWAKGQKSVPKKFTSEAVLSKITGYYVPFWLIDADCIADVRGTGQKYCGENLENYNIDRTVVFNVRKVPFDGCKKISNTLMEAIEPFDYKEMKDYNDMYLPGFFAQRYDLSAVDMLDLIRIRFDNYAEGIVKLLSAKEYDNFKTVNGVGTYSDHYKQVYALMPVWFLNIEYDGTVYGIAVNGQTGKASGSLPINKRKVHMHALGLVMKDILKYLGITLLFSALVTAALMFFTSGLVSEKFYMFFLLGFWIFISLVCLSVFGPFFKRKFADNSFYDSVTIDKAPNFEEYIDLKNKFNMDNRDSFMYMSSKTDDENIKKFARGSLTERLMDTIFK